MAVKRFFAFTKQGLGRVAAVSLADTNHRTKERNGGGKSQVGSARNSLDTQDFSLPCALKQHTNCPKRDRLTCKCPCHEKKPRRA